MCSLLFGTGRTSPIASADVAAVLRDPANHIGAVCELAGPEVLDINGLAEQYTTALGRQISAEDLAHDDV